MRTQLLIALFLIPLISNAQIGTGDWRLHVPNKKASSIVNLGNTIFTAFPTGVLEYNIDDTEKSMWTYVNGLSDINVSTLGVETQSNSVFVGYENGNIDQIQSSKVTNIPGIKLAQITGSKRVNRIVSHNGFSYFATGFGIVKIDPVNSEVKDTYYPTNGIDPITDITFVGDSIFAVSSKQIYAGKLTNPALADPAQWHIDSRFPIIASTSENYTQIEAIGNDLYILKNEDAYANDSVFKLQGNNLTFVNAVGFSLEITGIGQMDNKLSLFCRSITLIYNTDLTVVAGFQTYDFGNEINANGAVYLNNFYWIADEQLGMLRYFSVGGATERIDFEGPPRNEFFSMDWHKGNLAVVPGATNGSHATFRQAGLYFFDDEEWTFKSIDNQPLWYGQPVYDCAAVAFNPKNENQVAIATNSQLGLSMVDVDGFVTDTFTVHNSTLEFSANNWYNLTDVKYDQDGNLWVANGFCNTPLKLRTAGGEWKEFNIGAEAANKMTKRMVVDNDGNIWTSVFNVGLFGYKPGEDLEGVSDDLSVKLNDGEYTGALPSKNITALAVDFDNELWVGTDNGFGILYNPSNAFEASVGNYNVQRLKVEINGIVDYILGGTSITDIEVDGGNRKWFGTAGSGLILLSADGLEIIKQFNTDNSPLISDQIIDIEIDHNTGEVFVVTDKGLVSYRSDASYEDPEYDDVQIFPNPARPEFDGLITIQGIRYDSDVRITDVAGNLIYKTTSNGGTATWNGKTLQGERVATGVYLIWTASNITKDRFVGKVMVAN